MPHTSTPTPSDPPASDIKPVPVTNDMSTSGARSNPFSVNSRQGEGRETVWLSMVPVRGTVDDGIRGQRALRRPGGSVAGSCGQRCFG